MFKPLDVVGKGLTSVSVAVGIAHASHGVKTEKAVQVVKAILMPQVSHEHPEQMEPINGKDLQMPRMRLSTAGDENSVYASYHEAFEPIRQRAFESIEERLRSYG